MLWHAFLCTCTARTTMPTPRDAWDIAILLTSSLSEDVSFYTTHGVHTVSLLSSLFMSSLPAHIVFLSHCTVLTTFYKWSWLLSCGSFYLVWSTASCLDPRQRDTQSLLRTIWSQCITSQCDTRCKRCSKKQQLNMTWREMWPSLDSRSKIWCSGAIAASKTHSI